MIDCLLWDIDGTLLNFLAAEAAAIRALFAEFGLGECTDAMIARYSAINTRYWKMLERGEIEKPVMLRRRFEDFFAAEGIATDAARFNEEYQIRLGDTVVFLDRADELLACLQAKGYRQYAVTNGTKRAQRRKLERADLYRFFADVFISDEIGAEKPSAAFFDRVYDGIGRPEKGRVLIIGDSLSGDMRGGLSYGLRTCWYNPGKVARPADMPIEYEIGNLWDLVKILETGGEHG